MKTKSGFLELIINKKNRTLLQFIIMGLVSGSLYFILKPASLFQVTLYLCLAITLSYGIVAFLVLMNHSNSIEKEFKNSTTQTLDIQHFFKRNMGTLKEAGSTILLGPPGTGKTTFINKVLIPSFIDDSKIRLIVITTIIRGNEQEISEASFLKQSGDFKRDVNLVTVNISSGTKKGTLISNKLNIIILVVDPIVFNDPLSKSCIEILEDLHFKSLPIDVLISDEFFFFKNFFKIYNIDAVPIKYIVAEKIIQIIINLSYKSLVEELINRGKILYFNATGNVQGIDMETACTIDMTMEEFIRSCEIHGFSFTQEHKNPPPLPY